MIIYLNALFYALDESEFQWYLISYVFVWQSGLLFPITDYIYTHMLCV